MRYHHIFGPVQSRRLGVSLGVDLVIHKICSMDCVYCECGKTTDLTLDRSAIVPFDVVKTELDHYWAHNEDPDYITFSGSGEPCLNTDLGRVISYIKDCRPGIRVAVLTNATLLSDPLVRKALAPADLVVPSLDAVSPKAFLRINRPCPEIRPRDIISGIMAFSEIFKGQIWLEIFILPGVNDSDAELDLLKEAIQKIRPHKTQLNTLDRPGTDPGLEPATQEDMDRIIGYLGVDRVEVIARVKPKTVTGDPGDVASAVLKTIHRRPSTLEDLAVGLGMGRADLRQFLARLEAEGVVESQQGARGVFYRTVKGGKP